MAALPGAPSSDSGRISVPKLVTDPTWSLQPWPVTVTIAGEDLEIPALPASEWLSVLMRSVEELNLEDMFPGLVPDGREIVDQALDDELISLKELYDVIFDVISTASGRPWYVAMRLITYARNSWDVLGGELAYRHIDAAQMSLSGWLDAVLLTILRNLDQKDITMFTSQLEVPPPDVEQKPEDFEMSASQFLAMAD